MDNPTGIIHSLVAGAAGTLAIVDVDVGVACPRCAAGKGCGAGLLTGSNRIRRVEAMVGSEMSLAAGDSVEIALASVNVLRAALLVYGLPLAGGLTFAGIAYLFALGDAFAAMAAVFGLSLGLLFSRWRLRQDECIEALVPHVERRLPRGSIGA